MFERARLKLTAWYLLIIMSISILFSFAIYSNINEELVSIERMQEKVRQEQRDYFKGGQAPPNRITPEMIEQARTRLITRLFLINFVILGISGAAGYFLAARTLRPIKEMVDEQHRFIADASHELRTPLTALKSEIEVNLRNKNLTVQKAKLLLKSNLEEVNNLQKLSDYLIKLAQFKRGGEDLSLEKISLKETIDEAVKSVERMAAIKKIAINTVVKSDFIKANRQGVLELIRIFLDNAIKYSPEKTTITVTTKKIDRFIEIRIEDQGIGIAKQDLPHIFDRFYRSDKSRTKSAELGYGLGLSIAKQIVEKHHGSIKVQNAKPNGTIFTVNLPKI